MDPGKSYRSGSWQLRAAFSSLGNDKKTIGALLGDSHADAIADALGRNLGRIGLGIKDATYLGCPPIVSGLPTPGDDLKCLSYNNAVQAAVLQDESLTHVVIVSRWTMWLDGNGENLDNSARNGNGFDNEEGGVEVLWRSKETASTSVATAANRDLVRRRHIETIQRYLHAGKKVILAYPFGQASCL